MKSEKLQSSVNENGWKVATAPLDVDKTRKRQKGICTVGKHTCSYIDLGNTVNKRKAWKAVEHCTMLFESDSK